MSVAIIKRIVRKLGDNIEKERKKKGDYLNPLYRLGQDVGQVFQSQKYVHELQDFLLKMYEE